MASVEVQPQPSSYAQEDHHHFQEDSREGGAVRPGWFKSSHYGVMVLLFVVLLAIVIVVWVASLADAQITITVLAAFLAILYICQIVLGVPTNSGFM